MKKTASVLIAIFMLIAAISLSVSAEATPDSGADGQTAAIPDNTIITYGYLQKFKDELREELIKELTANGGIEIKNTYEEITLTEGQTLILEPDCELIFRGGSASAVTASLGEGEGITDISVGAELFSGERLSFGHIYHSGESESKKAVVAVGSAAYFTVKGGYELG